MNHVELFEYQEKAFKTAQYTMIGENPYYPVLGLCGEVGELIEEIGMPNLSGDPQKILKEAGDICWYAAAVARETGASLVKVFEGFDWHERGATGCQFDLILGAGKVAERVKKAMRDRGGAFDTETRAEIAYGLGMVLAGVSKVCKAEGFTLIQAMDANIEKLARRKANNTIKGEGSER